MPLRCRFRAYALEPWFVLFAKGDMLTGDPVCHVHQRAYECGNVYEGMTERKRVYERKSECVTESSFLFACVRVGKERNII